MQNKYKLPDDVRRTVISIVRGQERRKREYKEAYDNILNSSGAKYVTYNMQNGNAEQEQARAYLPAAKNAKVISDTERKTLALEALENSQDTQTMHIVESALNDIGTDIANKELRKQLSNAVYLNCLSRKHPYEYFFIPGISRKMFYKYKNHFLFSLAKKLNYF